MGSLNVSMKNQPFSVLHCTVFIQRKSLSSKKKITLRKFYFPCNETNIISNDAFLDNNQLPSIENNINILTSYTYMQVMKCHTEIKCFTLQVMTHGCTQGGYNSCFTSLIWSDTMHAAVSQLQDINRNSLHMYTRLNQRFNISIHTLLFNTLK